MGFFPLRLFVDMNSATFRIEIEIGNNPFENVIYSVNP